MVMQRMVRRREHLEGVRKEGTALIKSASHFQNQPRTRSRKYFGDAHAGRMQFMEKRERSTAREREVTHLGHGDVMATRL